MVLLCLSDIHGEGAGIADLARPDASSAGGSGAATDLIVLGGDITHLGGRREAAAIVEPVLATGIRTLALPGNMDRPEVADYLGELGILLHGRGLVIEGTGFFGLGGSNPTPFSTPFEVPDEEAAALLEAGWRAVAGAARKVLVSHAPPRGAGIDRSFAGVHAGSAVVRRFLESHEEVALCISGHIHEAAGEAIVGRTRCLNAGAWKNGRYAIVALHEGGVVDIELRQREPPRGGSPGSPRGRKQ